MTNIDTREFVIVPNTGASQGPQGPAGPQGPPGSVSLPITTHNVTYNSIDLTTIIDQLLYVPLVISSFTASQSNYEKGVVLTSIQLSWSYNKAIQTQSITGPGVTSPTLTISDRSYVVTLGSLTTGFVITLTSDDVTGDTNPPKTAQVSIQFMQKIYFGKAAIPGTVNSAFVLSLQSLLQPARGTSFNLSPGVSEYIWYACPVAYGLPSFTANGFSGGFDLTATISFTNASGYTESYYVFRSTNSNLGLTNVVVS